ncbi:caspase family protein [Thauera humireducens]|uniref:caspase family protein n=1 Tax=Thauera humireducens TaxID=1134435 RepID=UPI00311DDE74
MARRALCIGINDYPGTDSDLSGCVNDARDWSAELQGRGFEVTTLLDAQATRAAMIAAIEALIAGAQKNDTLVFTYSGHGTWVVDKDGDEPDGRDEALCPWDIHRKGPLLDDEIRPLFDSRGAGVRLLLISDSCHSGSVTRGDDSDLDPGGPRARFLPPRSLDEGRRTARRTTRKRADAGRRHALRRRRPAAGRLPRRRVQLGHVLRRTAQRRLHLLRAEDPAREEAADLRAVARRDPQVPAHQPPAAGAADLWHPQRAQDADLRLALSCRASGAPPAPGCRPGRRP